MTTLVVSAYSNITKGLGLISVLSTGNSAEIALSGGLACNGLLSTANGTFALMPFMPSVVFMKSFFAIPYSESSKSFESMYEQ